MCECSLLSRFRTPNGGPAKRIQEEEAFPSWAGQVLCLLSGESPFGLWFLFCLFNANANYFSKGTSISSKLFLKYV